MSNGIINIFEQAGLRGGANIFRKRLSNDENKLAEIKDVIAERENQKEI